MIKTREVEWCSRCNVHWEVYDYCLLCKGPIKLTSISINSEENMRIFQNTVKKVNKEQFDVELSEHGDGPTEIKVVSLSKTDIEQILNKSDFIFNEINGMPDKGKQRNCLGIALLDPYRMKGIEEDIRGLFIFLD
ncbi:hypothetical protein [Priestia megaterium]|uniref:hypothetical protein n=1 Tax=Priestia megaterium TaxID=1404 RepID=UPI000BFB178F|nr:hypothetical protein [Priestia megaterium]PGQ88246.1 hypothetical protein COA18_04785 [Priestia megaterium]